MRIKYIIFILHHRIFNFSPDPCDLKWNISSCQGFKAIYFLLIEHGINCQAEDLFRLNRLLQN